MSGFILNPEYSNGLLDNPEFQSLCESFLNSESTKDLFNSCPAVLGVQTQAEVTSTTGSVRDDGVSSLPSTYINNKDTGPLNSPLETTVLASSSPLDGIPLMHLLHAVVEMTRESLPPEYQLYCGSTGVVVETNEQTYHLCVEMVCDGTMIDVTNILTLKPSQPMPGDTVRIIRGESIGTVCSIDSRRDDSWVVVRVGGSPSLFLINDLIRLDTHSLNTTPPNISTSKYSPPVSNEWRVSSSIPPSPLPPSPVPPSPMDSIVPNYDTSPSSSLVGGANIRSPWSVSSDIPDLAFCLSDSSASSSNCSGASIPHPSHAHSLPNPLIDNGPLSTTTESFQNSTPYNSLPNTNQYEPVNQVPPTRPHPFNEPMAEPTTSPSTNGNLYPVLTGDSVFTPQTTPPNYVPRSLNTLQSSGVGVTYPTLPSYTASTQYVQQPFAALVNQQQQYMYGYLCSYQPQSQQYQQVGVVDTNMTPPQLYQSSGLYPQLATASMSNGQRSFLNQATTNPSTQSPSNCSTSLLNKSFPTCSRKKPGLYPQLPMSSKSPSKQLTPWDEFRQLVTCTQSGLSSKHLSIEIVIDIAIKELAVKDPPENWYNPLSITGDVECESELSTESVRVSALCPLSKQRMDYPCRGLSCTHLQCFDAKAFLKLALKRRSQLVSNSKKSSHHDNGWKCPMCGKIVSVNQLYIERFLQRAISSYDVTELEFKGASVWVPYENRCIPNAPVIDLTMDSDEDL